MIPASTEGSASALSPAVRRAVQGALEAEHQAVFGYGVVGAALGSDGRREVAAALAAHRARRDQLRTLLARRGVRPVASAVAYDLPESATDEAGARRLALHLEEHAAAFYADLAMVGGERTARLAAHALAECAVRAAQWRGEPVAFPGLTERAR